MKPLPRLYSIVDVESLRTRDLALDVFVRSLVDGGTEILQLRDKQGSPQQVLGRAEVLSRAVAGSDCLLIMNDQVDLALQAGWQAVHLGHEDMSPAEARGMQGAAGMVIGVSTHNDLQVQEAERSTADYMAIGPVFHTATKADAEPVVGLEGVRRARALTRKPLVAIGGITVDNAADVISAGADSVAVIGGLLRDGKNARRVVQDFLRRLR